MLSETQIIKAIKSKIQSKNYTKIMYNIIYNFLAHRKEKDWDLRKVTFFGLGFMVNSNYLVISDEKAFGEIVDNPEATTQFLLVRSAKGVTNLIVLQPIDKFKSREVNLLEWGYPVFEKPSNGVKSKDNTVFSNVLEEEIEIEPYGFDKPIKFSSLLNEKQLKLNDLIVNLIPDEIPPISTLMVDVLSK